MACIFCRIAAGEVPATVVHRDDLVTAFRDLNPKAPLHVLVIPNEHIPSAADVQPEHGAMLARMLGVAAQVVAADAAGAGGYRLVINNGANAGQSVDHLHLHVLAGRPLAWPPG
jgi:histidine triad (HIT) family protein